MKALILAMAMSGQSFFQTQTTPELQSLWYWAHSGCIAEQTDQYRIHCEIQAEIETVLDTREDKVKIDE